MNITPFLKYFHIHIEDDYMIKELKLILKSIFHFLTKICILLLDHLLIIKKNINLSIITTNLKQPITPHNSLQLEISPSTPQEKSRRHRLQFHQLEVCFQRQNQLNYLLEKNQLHVKVDKVQEQYEIYRFYSRQLMKKIT